MKIYKLILFWNLFFLFITQIASAQNKIDMRKIHIAGIIMETDNLTPILNANVYDKNLGTILATSDKNGYFRFVIDVNNEGEIDFSFIIKKEKYETITQNEHWGDLRGDKQVVYYFGLKHDESKINSFSEMAISKMQASYDLILSDFQEFKEKIYFNTKVQQKLKENQDVFLQIDGNYYVVSETGWIKLNSEKDLVAIDNNVIITADKINSILKRKEIRSMSTSDSDKFSIIILKNIE